MKFEKYFAIVFSEKRSLKILLYLKKKKFLMTDLKEKMKFEKYFAIVFSEKRSLKILLYLKKKKISNDISERKNEIWEVFCNDI